jgi:hypothetical protein
MEKKTQATPAETRVKEPYHEPLLLKHEPLLDITGTKSGEKDGIGPKSAESEKGLIREE